MRLKKYASKKVVAIVITAMVTLGSLFFQNRQIHNLKNQLSNSQEKIEQIHDTSQTVIDPATIQAKLNKQCEFKILDGTINIKHTYNYEREGFMGIDHTRVLTGTADFYYQITTDLRNATVIDADDKTIVVSINEAQVNQKSCHRIADTFIRINDECSQSLMTNKKDAEETARLWEDTFDKKGYEYVKEYYGFSDVRSNLQSQTEEQIKTLFEELGYNQNVEVVINYNCPTAVKGIITIEDSDGFTDEELQETFEFIEYEIGEDGMKQSNGFTLMEKTSEIKTYLNSQKVNRKINKIQIHHMASPSYSTWEKTDKKIFSEPHFGRTNSLNSYGKSTWGSRDDKGKYIAQHFNVFPDGQITSGRSLNSTPIGIKGWNTGAICIEIYGNFDKGKDQMNEAQKQAVVALVAELCDRFDIKPSANTIRYHAWFTAKGTYLGNYKAGRSTKTCPGTGFFGGNTMAAFERNFLPAIKNYGKVPTQEVINVNNYMVKVTADTLNVRKGPGTSYAITTQVKKNQVYTIVETQGKWGKLKSGAGWIHLGYTSKV